MQLCIPHAWVTSSFFYHDSRVCGGNAAGWHTDRKNAHKIEKMQGLKRKNGGKDHIMCGILPTPTPHIFSPLLKRLFNHSEENSRAGVHCPCWQHLLWRQWHSSCVQCDTRGRPLRSCWHWANPKLWSGLHNTADCTEH